MLSPDELIDDRMRIAVRCHPVEPLIAVADLPPGLVLTDQAEIIDEAGEAFTHVSEADFEKLVVQSPRRRAFAQKGQNLFVLPGDTSALLITL